MKPIAGGLTPLGVHIIYIGTINLLGLIHGNF
jgi:hypothetical protein